MGFNKKFGFSATLDAWLLNLSKTGRTSKQAVSILIDAGLVIVSLWGAYSLRLGELFTDFEAAWHIFVLLPVITVLVMAGMGIYRWVIRSSNRTLMWQLAKACLLSSIALALTSFLFPSERANPRSVFIIYGLLLTIGAISSRFVWQSIFHTGKRGEPVAIYGAGDAGSMLVQSLHQGSEFRPVLIIDDNRALNGTTVVGVPVRHPGDVALEDFLSAYEIGRVILAMPSLGAEEYESRVTAIRAAGLPVQTIPTYAELVSGNVKVEDVRDISISDILGRSEVPPDLELLGKCVLDKIVLVTGAGGSIGSELCRQIIKQRPRKLIALDHSEENLYKLTEEMPQALLDAGVPNDVYVPVLGSVNDAEGIDRLLRKYQVKTVYHAAAYKHVPIIEAQPEQGVKVNVLGTLCVLTAAIENSVDNFVLISTDKAVRPTNAMGATKRVAELILQAKSRLQNQTRISMVRFGNVLGSSGSVVPKFKKQIEAGGPITLTDPDVTRFFMTIPEAAQLVLQASSIAQGGDVFVLDMGEPVRIEDLAVSMVRMSGKRLRRDTGDYRDIEIEVSGLRPGEKMFEELFITDTHRATTIPKVFTAEEAWMEWSELQKRLETLSFLDNPADRALLRAELINLAFYGQASESAPLSYIVDANTKRAGDKFESTLELGQQVFP